MLNSVALLCELLTFTILFYCLMGRKFRIDAGMVVLFFTEMIVFWLLEMRLWPDILQVLMYINILIFIWIRFRGEKKAKIIACIAGSVIIISGLQIILFVALAPVVDVGLKVFFTNILELVAVFIIIRVIKLESTKPHPFKEYYFLYVVIAGLTLFFIMLVFLSKITGLSFLNCLLVAVIVLSILIFYQQWKTERDKNVLKEREIRVLQQCNESFEHLISDVRARQHEFNNQIETIYGLQYVCDTYDELVKRQNEYAAHIIRENRFNQILTLQCSSVIKGFLYYKFSQAKKQGIHVEYKIELCKQEDTALEADIQEIIGILFDNACEALEQSESDNIIIVSIMQSEKEIAIQTENPAPYMTQQRMQEYLKAGHSSKGKNRGYGLSNVKKLAVKHGGYIELQNIDKAGQNWLRVLVLLIPG